MFLRKNPDVLVVGAGPVGLFTALALTERGVRVQIMDREWRTGTRSYALALHAESLRFLDELGVLGPVLEGARRLRSVGIYDGGQKKAEMRIADLAEDHSFLAVLRQEDLEQMLVRELEKRGVKITWNHQVARLQPTADHVDVAVEKLSKDSMGYAVQHTEWVVSKSKDQQVGYVIGCDGHASAVRRSLGIEFDEIGPAAEFAVFEFKTDAELGDEMRLVMAEDTTNVCWPLPGGFCRWSFQKTPEEIDNESRDKDRDIVQIGTGIYPMLDEARLRALLAERAPWFRGSVATMRWRMVVRFERRLAASFGAGHAWIIGDAAHLTGPVGIQSMNVGFREGLDLADAIAGELGNGGKATLDEFGKRRLAEWRALLGVDDVLKAKPGTDAWMAARKDRLVPCIPASGADFVRIADQLGFACTMPQTRRTATKG